MLEALDVAERRDGDAERTRRGEDGGAGRDVKTGDRLWLG